VDLFRQRPGDGISYPAPLQLHRHGSDSAAGFCCIITSDSSVVERAVDLGINHFDTARVYQRGNNEHMVGAALKSKRKQIILASKTLARDKAGALPQLDQSLEAFSTAGLDIAGVAVPVGSFQTAAGNPAGFKLRYALHSGMFRRDFMA